MFKCDYSFQCLYNLPVVELKEMGLSRLSWTDIE